MKSYLQLCRNVKGKSGTASVNTDSQWSKQEACFAHATRVWLAVNHNTSVTSGERVDVRSILHGKVRLAAVNQICD